MGTFTASITLVVSTPGAGVQTTFVVCTPCFFDYSLCALRSTSTGSISSAVIVSNDSDLAEAMCLVRAHNPSKVLGLVFPRDHGKPSRELVKHANFVKHLSRRLLQTCQLPTLIPGTNLHKPDGW